MKKTKSLQQKAWAQELDKAVEPIRNRLKQNKVTNTTIDKLVEEIRKRR